LSEVCSNHQHVRDVNIGFGLPLTLCVSSVGSKVSVLVIDIICTMRIYALYGRDRKRGSIRTEYSMAFDLT
jgi:hypothetical protein